VLPPRVVALIKGTAAMGIWATSFILVKLGLDYTGPVTLAGLRYFLAFLILLPWLIRRRGVMRSWSISLWKRLCFAGISAYAIGNGALFWGLTVVPATTGAFLLSFTPLLVLFMSRFWLREQPTSRQTGGVFITLLGGAFFFLPGLNHGEFLGIGVILVGLFGFAIFSIIGRGIAREQEADTLALTAVPLATGGGVLLIGTLLLEGWPSFPLVAWMIVLTLAGVNTAVAYMLYNQALQSMTALEMNVLMNLMPMTTAVFAWLFLGDELHPLQLAGILIVVIGIGIVQNGRRHLPTNR
jgi:drug/metabolite transporter (DMT)-like permease